MTFLEKLEAQRVFLIRWDEGLKKFEIEEACDHNFSAFATAEELEALGNEIIALAQSKKGGP